MRIFKAILSLLSVLFLFPVLAGCLRQVIPQTVRGAGELTTQERNLTGVQGVALNTLGDLTIVPGEQQKLVIEAEENLLQYLVSDVQRGVLNISVQQGIDLQPTQPIRYTLTVPALDELTTNSLGSILAPALQAGNFQIRANSAGDIQLAGLDATELRVTISSSGDVQIDGGQVQEQSIRVSSEGNYRAPNLGSQIANVRLSSSGNAVLRVAERLSGVLSSSGNLTYYGDPIVEAITSSIGRVIRAGE